MNDGEVTFARVEELIGKTGKPMLHYFVRIKRRNYPGQGHLFERLHQNFG